MTSEEVIAEFKNWKPKDCLEAEICCGIRLVPFAVGRGAYRDIYTIKGLPDLIVKFPKHSKAHSVGEIKAIRKILNSKTKYTELKKLMPTLLYSDLRTGVIIMPKYKKLVTKYDSLISDLVESIVNLEWDEKVITTDVHYENLGLDAKGRPVIIDLGYFTNEGHDF